MHLSNYYLLVLNFPELCSLPKKLYFSSKKPSHYIRNAGRIKKTDLFFIASHKLVKLYKYKLKWQKTCITKTIQLIKLIHWVMINVSQRPACFFDKNCEDNFFEDILSRAQWLAKIQMFLTFFLGGGMNSLLNFDGNKNFKRWLQTCVIK